jgi:dihydroorotate dehydrogenase
MLNPYCLARPVLFALDPEEAHHLMVNNLSLLMKSPLGWLAKQSIPAQPVTVMGLSFPNPVGLAAGLDKEGQAIDGLAAMGFGFLEIGTVTPRPQSGNPKPRMFRLPEANALINRLGFNNQGLEAFTRNVTASHYVKRGGILGLNIGKNADTPIERATEDYLIGLRGVYPHASYVTVNISSPNTKNLRDLQQDEALNSLLAALKTEQDRLSQQYDKYVPIVLKIAPDLTTEQIQVIADQLLQHRFDGVIASNTTIARDAVAHLAHGAELGGLSGAPLHARSTAVIRTLKVAVGDALPIIGVGGILSGADAVEKIQAGATLVQIYTGLIYQGPALIKSCVEAIRAAHR